MSDYWWLKECHEGKCTASLLLFLRSAREPIAVWPVWQNPPRYFKFKYHLLKADVWKKASGELCPFHYDLVMTRWEEDKAEELLAEAATDKWAIEHGGSI